MWFCPMRHTYQVYSCVRLTEKKRYSVATKQNSLLELFYTGARVSSVITFRSTARPHYETSRRNRPHDFCISLYFNKKKTTRKWRYHKFTVYNCCSFI